MVCSTSGSSGDSVVEPAPSCPPVPPPPDAFIIEPSVSSIPSVALPKMGGSPNKSSSSELEPPGIVGKRSPYSSNPRSSFNISCFLWTPVVMSFNTSDVPKVAVFLPSGVERKSGTPLRIVVSNSAGAKTANGLTPFSFHIVVFFLMPLATPPITLSCRKSFCV